MFRFEALTLALVKVKLHILGVYGVVAGLRIIFIEGFVRLLMGILVFGKNERQIRRVVRLVGFVPFKYH